MATETDATNKPGIVDYLSAPRRKERTYLVAALHREMKQELRQAIENHLKASFPQLAVTFPKTRKELKRLLTRKVALLVTSDNFTKIETLMDLIKQMKERDNAGTPVIFLTEKPEQLIQKYHERLLIYEENDDYVTVTDNDITVLASKSNIALAGERRRSKRFSVTIAAELYSLRRNLRCPADIENISIHGCIIKSRADLVFQKNEQIQIRLVTSRFMPSDKGEFLRVSARIQRVFMGGGTAAAKWEHLSDAQTGRLSRYVFAIANAFL